MKKITLIIVGYLIVIGHHVVAQDRSVFYTGDFFNFTRNAAYTGSEELTNVFFDARTVAGNLPGSNQNFQFGAHSMFSDNNALGIKLLSDNQGPLGNMNAELSFAKRFQLTQVQFLTFGISAGFLQTTLNTSSLNNYVDFSDPTIGNGYFNQARFTAGFGARYQYNKVFDAGVSLPMIVTGNSSLNQSVIANASYVFKVGKDDSKVKLTPGAVYYYITSKSMADIMVKCSWNNLVSLTVGYRTNNSILSSVMLSLHSFSVGYAFNYSTGTFNNLYLGTNELLLSFNIASLHHVQQIVNNANQNLIEEHLQSIKNNLTEVNKNENKMSHTEIKTIIDKNSAELRKILRDYKVQDQDSLRNEVLDIKTILDELEKKLKSK